MLFGDLYELNNIFAIMISIGIKIVSIILYQNKFLMFQKLELVNGRIAILFDKKDVSIKSTCDSRFFLQNECRPLVISVLKYLLTCQLR